jgi:hypothetical protein
MKERPINFLAQEVRATLAGAKTQKRLVVKLPHTNPLGRWEVLPWGGPNGGRTRDGKTVPFQNVIGHSHTGEIIGCPYGQPGDRLWVREPFRTDSAQDKYPPRDCASNWPLWFEADGTVARSDRVTNATPGKLRSGMVMPRWASRITLEVTGVRVERLQDISEADAVAEGLQRTSRGHWLPGPCDHPEWAYHQLWDQINGPGSWDANPWVWVIQFDRVTP